MKEELIFVQDQIGYNFNNTDLLNQAIDGLFYSEEKADKKQKRVPRRVNTVAGADATAAELMIEEHDIEIPMAFDEEVEIDSFDEIDTVDETEEVETTFDSTADDIDAILNELRNRRED